MRPVTAAPTSNGPSPYQALRTLLAAEPDLLFAVLVGSRANGQTHPGSDWDIAKARRMMPTEVLPIDETGKVPE